MRGSLLPLGLAVTTFTAGAAVGVLIGWAVRDPADRAVIESLRWAAEHGAAFAT